MRQKINDSLRLWKLYVCHVYTYGTGKHALRFLLLHPVNTMVFTFLLLLVHFTLVKVAYCNSDATAAAVKVAMIAVAVRTEKPVEVIVADSPQQIAP